MARIRMLVRVTGTRNGMSWPDIGGVVDVPEDEAIQHIRMNNAVPAPGDPVDRDWLHYEPPEEYEPWP